MEGAHKASKLAAEDVISSMPENVITNIMNCLPIRDAVRTSILARNWRLKWTLLTELVFDYRISHYFVTLGPEGNEYYGTKIISRFLLHIKGPVTKFTICIPYNLILDVEDLNHWVLFLSRKGIKKFNLYNSHRTPLKLPTHLFSCLELTHMELHNCFFDPSLTFHGFPNLLSLMMYNSADRGEFMSRCPLLEIVDIRYHKTIPKVNPVVITKLENLKTLSLQLCMLDNMTMTASGIFQLVGFLPKLEKLILDLLMCKFVVEAGAKRRVPIAFPCLKTLTLDGIDFGSDSMLSCAIEMIWGSPNLQTLNISADSDVVPPPALGFSKLDCSTMGQLQLRRVLFTDWRGSESEVCLIKCLVACSPLLEKINVETDQTLLILSQEYL